MRRLLAAAAALSLAAFFCVPSSADSMPCVSADEIYVASSGGPPCAARQKDGELTDVLVPGDTVYLPIETPRARKTWPGCAQRPNGAKGAVCRRSAHSIPNGVRRRGLVPAGYRFVVALPISDILGTKTACTDCAAH